MERILDVRELSISFGGLRAVDDFSLELKKGELVGLIGPNGAGKTTVFNMLSGIYAPTEGRIFFAAAGTMQDITGLPSHKIARMGIARTFQNIRLLKQRTVLENVLVSFHHSLRYNIVDALFRTGRYYQEEKTMKEEALELLSTFGIADKAEEQAQNLPYGEQRKLEIVRALAVHPSLLLLDEPAAGMNPQETKALMEIINFIHREFDLTVLLIEHDMNLVMNVCQRLIVLDYGKIIAKGLPEEIKANPDVIKAYLGEEV
ncbi:ABC transporter ATP-binding protein [Spirochaetia bacterium 38H-sp]|uniref:ABC transporter ATP-binding protein n=1 Tax=Rarispira pelagica TaxID=3141764 RepID=A0ABU9U9A9_9SPIR